VCGGRAGGRSGDTMPRAVAECHGQWLLGTVAVG
jgi:hypothetical protein